MIKIYSGRITTLGDSTSVSSSSNSLTSLTTTTYSYVEFADGQIVRSLRSMSGLNGHVREGFQKDEFIELHVNELLTGVPDPGAVLLAIRRKDGRLFAHNVPAPPFIVKLMPIMLFVAGLFLMPLFFLGLLAWVPAWKMHKSMKMLDDVSKYVRSLNGAIEI
jgi:hypothetical protein